MAIRITCINKAGGQHYDPHSAIAYLGWINPSTSEKGKSTRLEIYEWLKNNSENHAYVIDRTGNKAYLYPRVSTHGTKFVQTYADRVWTDNLLSLPECTG